MHVVLHFGAHILRYFDKTFILLCSSHLCGSNAFNLVSIGAILMDLLIIYYSTTNLTTGQSILTHISHKNTHYLAYYIHFTDYAKDRSLNWSRPGKDRSEPVYSGSVRSFEVFQIWKTGLGLGPPILGSKDRTGPDFQTLDTEQYIHLLGSLYT